MSDSKDAQKDFESKIDLAIKTSSDELKRLSKLYHMRGRTAVAREIDDAVRQIEERAKLLKHDELESHEND